MSARSIEAGRAFVRLGLIDDLSAGLKRAQRRMQNFGAGLKAAGTKMVGVGAALAIPIAMATSIFANFDDAIRSVGAVTQATTEELESMRSTAAELGRTTSFTATEVANLMTELGRAGFSPRQINEMTHAVLALSRATGTDATQASGIMAATLRQFSMEASEAGRVADVLAAGANKSFNTVEGLGEALAYAGPVAADFGMELEEVVAILGSLGNVGIQGSAAGTSLRRLLTLTGAEAQKLERIFGVSFVDSAGNARPLVDALDDVNRSTADLGTAARSAKFNEAFGLLGITGASAIGRVAGSTRDLQRELENAAGTAASTAEKMDAGIGGVFRRMMSAVEGIANAFGSALAGPLGAVVEMLTVGAGVITEWIEANQGVTAAIAGFVAGLITLGATLVAAGVTVSLIGSALGGIATVIGLVKVAALAVVSVFSGPFAAVAVAIGLVGTAAAVAAAKAGLFADAWEWAKGVMRSVMALAKQVFDGVRAAIAGGDLLLAVKIAWAGIKVAFFSALDAIAKGLGSSWGTMFSVAKRFFKSLLELVWNTATAIPRMIIGALTKQDIREQIFGALSQAAFATEDIFEGQMLDAKRELSALRREAAELAKDKDKATGGPEAGDGSGAGGTGGSPPGSSAASADNQEASDQIAERIEQLREEVRVTKLGKDAAESLKFARMGATAAELGALAAAQEHRNAVEENERAMKEAREERERETEELKRRAEDINQAMRSPFQVFKDEVDELRKLRGFGLTDDAFRKSFKAARERLREATEDTGERVEKVSNTGTFSGFAALRGAGDPMQARIAKAAEDTRDAVRDGNRKLDNLGPPKFRK